MKKSPAQHAALKKIFAVAEARAHTVKNEVAALCKKVEAMEDHHSRLLKVHALRDRWNKGGAAITGAGGAGKGVQGGGGIRGNVKAIKGADQGEVVQGGGGTKVSEGQRGKGKGSKHQRQFREFDEIVGLCRKNCHEKVRVLPGVCLAFQDFFCGSTSCSRSHCCVRCGMAGVWYDDCGCES